MFEPRDYAAAIRALRGEKRTQKECAFAAGIDRPTWNQYEKGKVIPGKQNYAKVARGLGVTEPELTEAVIGAWRERMDRTLSPAAPAVVEAPQGVLIVALGPGSVLLSTPSVLEVHSV